MRVRGTACSGMGQEEPQPVCEEPPNLEMVGLPPWLQAGLPYRNCRCLSALAPWALAVLPGPFPEGAWLNIWCECQASPGKPPLGLASAQRGSSCFQGFISQLARCCEVETNQGGSPNPNRSKEQRLKATRAKGAVV